MKSDLPVMIGKHLQKGLIAFPNRKFGGYDLCVVWLNKDFDTGDEFEMTDIDNINAVLHFCDLEGVEATIRVLEAVRKGWEKDEKRQADPLLI